MSSPTCFISAIFSVASSLLRFRREISSVTVLRYCFNCSVFVIKARRSSSKSRNSSTVARSTPRFPSAVATSSKFSRMRLISSIVFPPFCVFCIKKILRPRQLSKGRSRVIFFAVPPGFNVSIALIYGITVFSG